jgi:hypothetical protein
MKSPIYLKTLALYMFQKENKRKETVSKNEILLNKHNPLTLFVKTNKKPSLEIIIFPKYSETPSNKLVISLN